MSCQRSIWELTYAYVISWYIQKKVFLWNSSVYFPYRMCLQWPIKSNNRLISELFGTESSRKLFRKQKETITKHLKWNDQFFCYPHLQFFLLQLRKLVFHYFSKISLNKWFNANLISSWIVEMPKLILWVIYQSSRLTWLDTVNGILI